jgi:tRNA:m4X modification enzyme
VGKRFLAAFGIAPWEFEVLAWCTSWALCGHTTPAGAALDGEEGEQSGDRVHSQGAGSCSTGGGGDAPASSTSACALPLNFHPADIFETREERVAFGLRCKQLIDAGRAARLAELAAAAGAMTPAAQGTVAGSVEVVEYIDSRCTGENTALVLALGR